MSETPIPVGASIEANAVDKLVQMAWDRFAALDEFDNIESELPSETREIRASDDDDRGSDH